MSWFLLAVFAAAPVTPPTARVSYAQALALVDAAPDVERARLAATIHRDAPRPGLLSSNPQVLAQPGFSVDNGALAPEGQLTLQQAFNLGGLAGARRRVAKLDAETADLEATVLQRARRLEVSSRWLELWAAQEAARLAHDEEQFAKDLVERFARAATSGAGTRVEYATARAFAAEAAALHLEWEGRRVEAGALLAERLGLAELAEAEGPLPGALPAASEPLGKLELSQVRAALDAERARREESAAQWASQLQVSAQGGRQPPGQWVGNLGLGLTLPLFETGRRKDAAHRAAIARLEGRLSATERQNAVRLRLARHEVEHALEVLGLLEGAQLPAAEEAARLETRRLEQGEATVLELSLLRRQALAARVATVLARARAVAAQGVLEELGEAP